MTLPGVPQWFLRQAIRFGAVGVASASRHLVATMLRCVLLRLWMLARSPIETELEVKA